MTKPPKLYPNHQHQWTDDPDDLTSVTLNLVRCTVCGFTAPRTLAGLDGDTDTRPTSWQVRQALVDAWEAGNCTGLDGWVGEDRGTQEEPDRQAIHDRERDVNKIIDRLYPDTDVRCTHQHAAGQCLDHQGHLGDHQHPQPAQETPPA